MSQIAVKDVAVLPADDFSELAEGETAKIITTEVAFGPGIVTLLSNQGVTVTIQMIVEVGSDRIYYAEIRGNTIARLIEVITAYADLNLAKAAELITAMAPKESW